MFNIKCGGAVLNNDTGVQRETPSQWPPAKGGIFFQWIKKIAAIRSISELIKWLCELRKKKKQQWNKNELWNAWIKCFFCFSRPLPQPAAQKFVLHIEYMEKASVDMTEGEDESNENCIFFLVLLFYYFIKPRTVILLHKSFPASSFTTHTQQKIFIARDHFVSVMAWHGVWCMVGIWQYSLNANHTTSRDILYTNLTIIL